MHIQTPVTTVNKSPEELFNFLNDLGNFEQLMPENLDKFQLLSDTRFLFALKGMPEIVLEKKESLPHQKLVLGAASDKLPFTLSANILEDTEGKSKVNLDFEGNFNPMMAMMVKAPLNKFMNTLSENLGKL